MQRKRETKFNQFYDFKTAQKWPNEPVYMGSFKGPLGDIQHSLAKPTINNEITYFKLPGAKNIFYPEAAYRLSIDSGKWSYKKNQAYWAGAMIAKRKFQLLTPLHFYKNKLASYWGGGTVSELLWLSDNGYIFEAKNGLLIARPPVHKIIKPILHNYAYMNKQDPILRQAMNNFLQKVPLSLLNLSIKTSEVNDCQNQDKQTEQPQINESFKLCNIL
ncbi:hypothetical protein ACNVED_15600 (plasmid) [Legionella sp. D16C41]|uniref:hypothetical protein n=1 Tax=Legionella sp. D16C41 TaxID=3402688 RepID=UPI003AF8BAA8